MEHMRLLLADIGNTTVVLARFIGGKVKGTLRLGLAENNFEADVGCFLGENPASLCAAVSVNEKGLRKFRKAARKFDVKKVVVAGRDFSIPIRNSTLKPEGTGNDRLLAALGAYRRHNDACIVIDAGSAITVDLVDAQGAFLGGAILPGARMAASALADCTDKLPFVEPALPRNLVGRDTARAIRAGVHSATAGGVAWLVARYRKKLKAHATVFITGGDAKSIGPLIDSPKKIVPTLVLEGLAFAALEGVGEP